MTMKTKIITLPVVLAFVAILFPLLATLADEDHKPKLTGIVISNEKPEFTRKAWFTGEYQRQRDDYSDDHWAYKEQMVRLNNQLYYELFNQIRVKSFVIGKEDYLFSENYIFSAFGDDLVPEQWIKGLLEKAKVVQDTLKKKGIDLLLVFAPGKGVGCREFVEDKYIHPVKTTNHERFLKHSAALGVNTLDLYT